MSVKQAIVFGAPRSGTTFLMGALEALPAAECVSGNLLPVGVVHLAAQDLATDVRELLQRSFAGAFVDYLDSSAYRARAPALRKWWISGHRPAALRAAAQGRRLESILVYKEPFLAFVPELAYEAFPDARLIYLLRDGRDVADSLVRSYDVLSDEKLRGLASNEVMLGRALGDLYIPWWVEEGKERAFLDASQYARAVWMWREMVRRCRRFLDRADVIAAGRVLTVRYEALVSDPLAQGDAIAAHLGQQLGAAARARLGTAHARSVGNHTRRAGAEVLEAERLAGVELEALGYTPGAPAGPVAGATAAGASTQPL